MTTTVYAIKDRRGEVRAYHVRVDTADGKDVSWLGPDRKSGLNGTPSSELPLYNAHRLDEWPDPIIVTEGEKAAYALVKNGFHAVGTVTGAASTPSDDVLADLEGRAVILWPDADDVGRAHMRRVGESLVERAAVGWLEPPADVAKGWDAADAVAESWDIADTLKDATGFELKPKYDPWTQLGLRRLADVADEPQADLLVERLAPEGHTILYGTGGTGKGALAVRWIGNLVSAGHRVLVIDYEDHVGEWRGRLGSLCGREALEDVHIVSPLSPAWQGPLGPLWEQSEALGIAADAADATYLVIDSIVVACFGTDPLAAEAPALYASGLVRLGRPALSLAHVNRAGDHRYPFGSVFWHNLARLTWSMQSRGETPGEDAVLALRKHNNYPPMPRQLVSFTWSDDRRLMDVWEKDYREHVGDLVRELLLGKPDGLEVNEITRLLNEDLLEGEPPYKANTVLQAMRRRNLQFAMKGKRWVLA